MKRKYLHLLMLVVTLTMSLGICAQGQHGGQGGPSKFNPEEFRVRLEGHISRQAGFSAQESQKFFSIYHEMKDKQHKLQQEMFKLKKNRPANSASDKDYLNTIQKIKDLNVEIAQIEENYYKKMCKAISPKKVYQAMLAEDEFHRQMLRRFNRERDGNRNERNNHRSNQRKPHGER